MLRRMALLFCLVLVGAVLPAQSVRADGIIIPEPPLCLDGPCPPLPCLVPPCPPRPHLSQLVIRYHRVSVTIQDQLAITRVDQVFYNPNDWQIEGDYVFPVPPDAAISDFNLWVDGQAVQAKILDAEKARQVYEDIVRRANDPALLEYAGRGALRARIFPIPPGAERRVELQYSQALEATQGLVRYTYPLNTEKFSLLPLEQVSITVDVRSSNTPLRAIYSPSHAIDIARQNDRQARASFETSQVRPDSDFSLYYSLGETEAFHLLSYRDLDDPADKDGFFLALLASGTQAAERVLPKNIILVLDRSGSMEGEKFQQAQQALRYVLEHLGPQDRFSLITFSSGVDIFSSALQPIEHVPQALAWVNSQAAVGSTDIHRALLEASAMADRERPTYLIFLTDGLPTSGVTDSERILSDFGVAAPESIRLFVFGVGYDVDTLLLDTLATEHHGRSTYIQPSEHLDEVLSAFYAQISSPVLTDLELDFGSTVVYDIYPQPLPDLFVGSQVVIVGRYRESGTSDVTLAGLVDGEEQVQTFSGQIFIDRSSVSVNEPLSAIPQLWATRKIGYLLNKIRLNGPDAETIDQIVRLSIRFGVVTPYTSYLVTEELPLGAAEQRKIADQAYNEIQAAPPAAVSGQEAVQKAADQAALAGAQAAPAPSEAESGLYRTLGAKTFLLHDGVWIDTAYDPQAMLTTRVDFLSDSYFALARQQPAAAAFALGPRVIVLVAGIAVEVVDSGGAQQIDQLPDELSDPLPGNIPSATTLPMLLSTPTSTLAEPASGMVTTPDVAQPPGEPRNTPQICPTMILPLAVIVAMVGVRKRSRA